MSHSVYRPIIIGLSGPTLSASECDWIERLQPYGFIVFRRNITSPDQVSALTDTLVQLAGRDCPIFIDQEGGRVQRLGPPHWPALPSPLAIGQRWRRNAFEGLTLAHALGQVIGHQLASLGITHTCAPCLDLAIDGADPVIGDRAFGTTPAEVIPLALAFLDGLQTTGVSGVMKHLPGMGRVTADSHLTCPVIETPLAILDAEDWLPFQVIQSRFAMTAHVTLPELGPQPVTVNDKAIARIRSICPDSLLISDCLTMGALEGSIEARVIAALDAGCDLALYSNGSDSARKRAVLAAGEPRVARDPARTLTPLPEAQIADRLGLLEACLSRELQADPTRDQP